MVLFAKKTCVNLLNGLANLLAIFGLKIIDYLSKHTGQAAHFHWVAFFVYMMGQNLGLTVVVMHFNSAKFMTVRGVDTLCGHSKYMYHIRLTTDEWKRYSAMKENYEWFG